MFLVRQTRMVTCGRRKGLVSQSMGSDDSSVFLDWIWDGVRSGVMPARSMTHLLSCWSMTGQIKSSVKRKRVAMK